MDLSIAVQGMRRADAQLDRTAAKIARTGAQGSSSGDSFSPLSSDTVDFSENAASLLVAKNAFEANAVSLRIGAETSKTVIDLIA